MCRFNGHGKPRILQRFPGAAVGFPPAAVLGFEQADNVPCPTVIGGG